MLTERNLQELVDERHADYMAEVAQAKPPKVIKAEALRKKTALETARRLEAACNALRANMRACNECGDASATLERQGKGIDGRTKLVADMAEYAGYLLSVYGEES